VSVPDAITCPRCGMTSWNPNDVRERYCGNCHAYHDDMPSAEPGLLADVTPPETPTTRDLDERANRRTTT
jgi:hypothetical protein